MSPDEMTRQRKTQVAARYRKRRALAELRGIPTSPIPAAPIRAHVNRLIELGWGTPAILAATRVDATPAGLLLIANGHSRRAERKFEPILSMPITLHVPEHVPDEMLVPSLGAARRVRALMALGWRHEDIVGLLGGRSSSHLSAHRHKTINAHDWRLVDAVYEALGGTPGPSERSRRRATCKGYVPPLAWDDIDDPDEQPKGMKPPRYTPTSDLDEVKVDRILRGDYELAATPAEKREVVRRWAAVGRSLAELDRRTGWNTNRYRDRESGNRLSQAKSRGTYSPTYSAERA